MVARSRGGGEGALRWPRLTLEQEFAKGALSAGRGSRGPAWHAKEEDGWGSSSARTGRAGDVLSYGGGGQAVEG
jgi:hypothetical protein